MNYQRKNSAVKKYSEIKDGGATIDEVSDLIRSDEKKYSEEEWSEIFDALFKEDYNKPPSKLPNDSLDLSGFNYNPLEGKDFENYNKLIASLRGDDQYDFELFKAAPIMKQRFEGMEGTPWDHVGIRLVSEIVVHKTRVPVKVALELNSQILNAHSRAGHGRYYLLKRPA